MKDSYQDGYFERFTTEQLEEMIDLGLDLSAHENREALLQILEVLEERESPVDVEEAWQEFQTYYNIPEGKGIELYETGMLEKKKKKPTLRLPMMGRVAIAAAALIVLMTVGVTSLDYDNYGVVGQWTEDTFHFFIKDNPTGNPLPKHNEHRAEFQRVIHSFGVNQALAPGWYPNGFEPDGIRTDGLEDEFDQVWAEYVNKEEDRFYSVSVTINHNLIWLEGMLYTKNSEPVETYTSNGRCFYILSHDGGGYTALWSDGRLVEAIVGDLTMEELKAVIDSIL